MRNNTITSLAGSSLFLALALVAAGAAAQVVPGSALPSHVGEQFDRPSTEPQPQPSVTPNVTVPQTVVAKELAQKFTLRSVKIDDVTVYPAGTFDSIYRDKIGQTITLDEARVIARAITARYRTDGYMLSQAVIPKQDLTAGVLHIRVVEGFIDKVYIENPDPERDSRNLIAGYAEKIRNQQPLNSRTLERYMLLINDLPGVKARAVLRPAPSTFGAADLVIQVQNKGLEGSVTSDNRGNKYLGPYQEQASLTENSLAGLGERTIIRGINTIPESNLHFYSIQHEEQIDSEGTRAIALVDVTQTHPGSTLEPLNFEGTSDDYSLSLTHPFLRSRAENFTGNLTFDARDTENDEGGTRLSNDRIRALRLGGNYDTGDTMNGIDQADLTVSQGVPWLDATGDGTGRSRTVGDQEFTKFNADLSRLQNLPHGFSILTAATGQYSEQPLLISEQMTLGGVGFGQAYDTGEVSGDSGAAGKVELRYGQPVGAQWFDSYQLYGYYDIGSVFVNDAGAGAQNQFSLASLGTGVRANFTSNLYGYLEVAQPLTREIASEGNKDPRLFFSLTARF